MKKILLWSSLLVLLVGGFSIFAALKFGKKSPVFASGKVLLDPRLIEEAKGIRTLYITVFDANSPMPMPYGAMRERIDRDPQQTVLEFNITKEKLQIMNPNAHPPKKLRIKARLDKDGVGGRDQPGDLTGERSQIAFGESRVDIKINRKVD